MRHPLVMRGGGGGGDAPDQGAAEPCTAPLRFRLQPARPPFNPFPLGPWCRRILQFTLVVTGGDEFTDMMVLTDMVFDVRVITDVVLTGMVITGMVITDTTIITYRVRLQRRLGGPADYRLQ